MSVYLKVDNVIPVYQQDELAGLDVVFSGEVHRFQDGEFGTINGYEIKDCPDMAESK